VTWLLDTNVVAGLMRGDELLVARLERLGRGAVRVPEPVWAEIEYGLARLPPSRRREHLRGRYEFLRDELISVVWSPQVSAAFGHLKAGLKRRGERLEDLDVAIAAHAVAIEATLVTANVRHLARVGGLKLEDWSRP
jgi:tRNA(fMet)-specific endonuclease VapC